MISLERIHHKMNIPICCHLLVFFLLCCGLLAKEDNAFNDVEHTANLPFESCLIFPYENAYFPCSPKLVEIISKLKLSESRVKIPRKIDENTWWIKLKDKNPLIVSDGFAVDSSGQSFLLPNAIRVELERVRRDIEQSTALIQSLKLHAAFTGLKHAPSADWEDKAPLNGVYIGRSGPAPIARVDEFSAKHLRHILARGATETSSKSLREINLSPVIAWVDGVKYAVIGNSLVNCKDRNSYIDSKKWLHRILEFEVQARIQLSDGAWLISAIKAAKKFDVGVRRHFRSKERGKGVRSL